MAPSDGVWCRLVGERKKTMLLMIFFISALVVRSGKAALVARTQYTMDQSYDCVSPGIQDVPRGQTTYLHGRSQSGTPGSVSNCLLQFEPQSTGDVIKVWFESGAYIEDCDVTLDVEVSNAGKYSYGCLSQTMPDMLEAENGIAKIWLRRKNFDNINYNFRLAVRAQRSVDEIGVGSSSAGDAGMIAGIVAGVIVFIIILAVICIFCRRRRRENLAKARARSEMKQDLTKESLNTSLGYDNKAAPNGSLEKSANESPSSDRRLLVDKPRSALDRFGPSPSQRRRQLNSRDEYEEDVERGRGGRGVYEEREVRARDDRPYQDREYGRRRDDYSDSEDSRRNDYVNRNYGRRREEEDRGRAPEPQRGGNPDLRSSPLLADLQNNPKFRRSFHENEASAAERVKRVSANLEDSRSSGSVDSTGVPRPPKLPPVPKSPPRSPSPQRRGEKIAGIFRARPSSSSSEIARVDEETEVGESPRSVQGRSPHRELEEREKKADTRHTLRPNRGEDRRPREEKRRDRRDEDESEEERRRERRERDRRDEERARRRRQEEEEEEEEEERRRRKEEKRRKEEAKRRQEEDEEEEDRRRRRREKERDDDKKEYEGRFKKSASGRRSKGKGTNRMGRSRSTGNALEEMDSNYQRSRSKSPSSVRSLNFVEDDDEEDLDSNYMPFRRAGSKTSLYASRTSLYGRRRKNSMGETMSMSSYAHDDLDSRMGDFDRVRMSHREKEKMFRSTGDLEMRPASAQIVRDCATQTGSERAVYVYGKKTLAKERPGKRYSRGTQTGGRERRDSVGSGKSGRSTRSNPRLKSRSKSQESLRREKRSRSRGFDDDDDDESDRDRRRGRSKSRDRDYSDDELEDRRRKRRSKSRDASEDEDDRRSKSSRSKPKARPRRSQGTASVDLSDSADDLEDDKSGIASSVAHSSVYPPSQQGYPPAMYPAGYPMAYTPAGVPYVPVAPGGPPPMVVVGGGQPPAASNRRPPVAPKPSKSKWDQLVAMTDGEKRLRHQGASVAETESVLSSAYGAHPQVAYAPPSYTSAQRLPDPNSTFSSAYPDSSGAYPAPQGYRLNYGSSHTPSDSMV